MTIRTQLSEYISRNVWKGKNEVGQLVWKTFDPREGDHFESETHHEAVSIFVRNWDNLTEEQKCLC